MTTKTLQKIGRKQKKSVPRPKAYINVRKKNVFTYQISKVIYLGVDTY